MHDCSISCEDVKFCTIFLNVNLFKDFNVNLLCGIYCEFAARMIVQLSSHRVLRVWAGAVV